MLNIGCHLSVSKGYEAMGKEALKLGANTFQFFSRNPRGGNAKKIDEEDIEALVDIMGKNNFAKILAHAPYTLNPCSKDESIRKYTVSTMAEDLRRMEYLPGNFYNFHPGSHVKQGVEIGIKYITDMLNAILKPEQKTTVLLETMAGKGTEIGRTFEEIKEIIDGVKLPEKVGVCLDTCHVFDGGYDIVNNLDGVLENFDDVVGLDKLCAVHLNDSKNPLKSHKDRHEKIGQGYIGKEAIFRIINHPKLRSIPFILETPNDLSGYAEEIRMLKQAYEKDE